MQDSDVKHSENNANFRFPTNLMLIMQTIFAISPNSPVETVAQFASNGTPYAWKICTKYGRIPVNPLSCPNKNSNITSTNGLRFRFRISSCSFIHSVGGGWSHLTLCAFWQGVHLAAFALYRCISWNSFSTALGETHPRSHCSDLRASSLRSFDSNHMGVSGTKQIAIMVASGIDTQMAAVMRHVVTVPSR